MLSIENLNHHFGRKKVLQNFSFTFQNGVYGLLGPNGAGKTTLLRCITKLYSVPRNTIFFNGIPIEKEKAYLHHVGYLPQKFGVFQDLSVQELLQMMCVLQGIEKKDQDEAIQTVLEQINLTDRRHDRVGKLSGGMIRRLGIGQALLNKPELLIFDEPTAGLDPEERLRFKNIISEIKGEVTILISTHIVEDVEAVCDHIAILQNGMLLASGSCTEIAQYAAGKVYQIPQEEIERLNAPFTIQKQLEQDGKKMIRLLSNQAQPFAPVAPNIEDGYLCSLKQI